MRCGIVMVAIWASAVAHAGDKPPGLTDAEWARCQQLAEMAVESVTGKTAEPWSKLVEERTRGSARGTADADGNIVFTFSKGDWSQGAGVLKKYPGMSDSAWRVHLERLTPEQKGCVRTYVEEGCGMKILFPSVVGVKNPPDIDWSKATPFMEEMTRRMKSACPKDVKSNPIVKVVMELADDEFRDNTAKNLGLAPTTARPTSKPPGNSSGGGFDETLRESTQDELRWREKVGKQFLAATAAGYALSAAALAELAAWVALAEGT